jgi:hypothetical protein
MTVASTKTSTKPVPVFAQKVAEQLVSSVKHGQQLTVDAAQAWTKAVSVLPMPDLPKVPGIQAAPDVEAIANYTFDLAADLLKAQREFTLQLANTVAK